jgi:hypothetical protein
MGEWSIMPGLNVTIVAARLFYTKADELYGPHPCVEMYVVEVDDATLLQKIETKLKEKGMPFVRTQGVVAASENSHRMTGPMFLKLLEDCYGKT